MDCPRFGGASTSARTGLFSAGHLRSGGQLASSSQKRCGRAPGARVEVTCTLMEPRDVKAVTKQSPVVWTKQEQKELFGKGKEVEENAMRACMKAANGTLPEWNNLLSPQLLESAYQRCGEVTAEYAKSFYFATSRMSPEKARAVWAIYVWCRRTDELVDGPHASKVTPKALERWEERIQATFDGEPYDVLDAAISHAVCQYPVSIQPFKDMVDGMRMDLVKSRYKDYSELYEYCYRVAGTVALMTVPIMGIDENYEGDLEPVYRAALSLGLANQLTNILRDVGEDAKTRGRIYLPLDELEEYGISESDILQGNLYCPSTGKVDDRWKAFMKFQIARAREVFKEAEDGVNALHANARWPVWCALVVYREILDYIELNDYDNFSKRAYVPKWKKFAFLPYSYYLSTTGLPKK